jgi:UDP-N-acetylglucosamine 2-epimerase (non-hydrolysing)
MEMRRREIVCPIIHSGQHYDFEMSQIFFSQLDLPEPDFFLKIDPATQGHQTGQILARAEEVLVAECPDLLMVLGDTNTTLAGALAAIKLRIPVGHIEAGVRSFDMTMPEEINRRVVDSISTLCFAPTERAVRHLAREGRREFAHLVGDTLVEVSKPLARIAQEKSDMLDRLRLEPHGYGVVTLHRSENVDNPKRATSIVSALTQIDCPLVYPIHPRARKMFSAFGLLERLEKRLTVIDPLGYLDFLCLLGQAQIVLTDSGGVQQEASILSVPCVTLRYNTEWIETLEAGKNFLAGTDTPLIADIVSKILENQELRERMVAGESPFREGASKRIVNLIEQGLKEGTLEVPTSNFLADGFQRL